MFYGKQPQLSVELVGPEVEFSWEISEDEVGENAPLIGVTMSSSGKYHRNRESSADGLTTRASLWLI